MEHQSSRNDSTTGDTYVKASEMAGTFKDDLRRIIQRAHGCSIDDYCSRLPKTEEEGKYRERKGLPWVRAPDENPNDYKIEAIRDDNSAEKRIETASMVSRGVPEKLAGDVVVMTMANSHDQTHHVLLAKRWYRLKDHQRGYRHLMISGTHGSGKSYAGACLLRTVPRIIQGFANKNSKTARFIRANDLYELLAGRMTAEHQAALQSLQECNLLMIDNLGGEIVDDKSLARLFALIDNRHERDVRTIYTSELNQKDFEERYSSQITDRIYSCGLCDHYNGESMR